MRKGDQTKDSHPLWQVMIVAGLLTISVTMSLWPASAHQGATGIVKERMDKFSEARQQMRQMSQNLTDLEAIAETSEKMLSWAQEMNDAFPEGSDGAPSEAAPEIWTDREGFDLKIKAYYEAVLSLNEAALSGDQKSTVNAFKAVGASCKSCHQSYRR